MRYLFALPALIAGAMFAHAAPDGETGDAVIVVYNSAMPESKDVALHYAEMRRVPPNQLLGLDLPTWDDISRKDYNEKLETPLRNYLEAQKLLVLEPDPAKTNAGWVKFKEGNIHYAVLCYGVPLRIAVDPNLKEPGAEKYRDILRGNGAAVDSELSLLPCPNTHRLISGYIPNPYYGTSNATVLNPAHGILPVTRLDGPTAAIARGLVDKALEAERDGLWGRAYFDIRGIDKKDPVRKGDDWITAASVAAKNYGFETVVDDKVETFPAGFPMSAIALYAGWYDWNASGPFAQPTVEFMPGAFAYHLHSYSAQTLRSTTKNWCGPLLAKGATATMGCVNEPYLELTPNIGMFFQRLLAGLTFGEAAYACQPVLSWQTTVVGDPLYRPFGKNPQKLHEALQARQSPMLPWSHLRVIDLSLNHGVAPVKLEQYIQEVDPNGQSPVLMEKLGDLYQLDGQPGMALITWQKVLRLHPSQLQAARIVLRVGEKLLDVDKREQALALYEIFVTANPDYAGARDLYEKMEILANRLHQHDKAKHYAEEVSRLTVPPAK